MVTVAARTESVLFVVPAYGRAELTDAVLGDLLAGIGRLPAARIVVVDNMGDYRSPYDAVTVHRSGQNLRWIGSANWALQTALDDDVDVCVVVNNDTRLSADFGYWLALGVLENDGVALAAPCYNDFWLHQRADPLPATVANFQPRRAYRQVPFCDGTALAFRVSAIPVLGLLDQVAFPRHGYGADVDYALRAGDHGLRCVITEAAYLDHLRRGTMNELPSETSEVARSEIVTGLDRNWGDKWRELAGLSEQAFPPFNKGSAQDWYR